MKHDRSSEIAAIAALIRISQTTVINTVEAGLDGKKFHLREQFVMDEKCFHDVATILTMATEAADQTYGISRTSKSKDDLTYEFYFGCVKLTMQYERNLGGCFCMVDDAIDDMVLLHLNSNAKTTLH